MAKPKTPPPAEPKRVTCGECKHFQRDTSGISYNNDTHEYFMGVCDVSLTPDNMKKVFANKPRKCNKYHGKESTTSTSN